MRHSGFNSPVLPTIKLKKKKRKKKGFFNKITFHTKIKICITYFLVLFYFIIFLLTNTDYLLTGDDFDVRLCG